MWKVYKNTDNLVTWKLTNNLIYLINNNPKYGDLVLRVIDEQSPNEYDINEETQGDNNEDT